MSLSHSLWWFRISPLARRWRWSRSFRRELQSERFRIGRKKVSRCKPRIQGVANHPRFDNHITIIFIEFLKNSHAGVKSGSNCPPWEQAPRQSPRNPFLLRVTGILCELAHARILLTCFRVSQQRQFPAVFPREWTCPGIGKAIHRGGCDQVRSDYGGRVLLRNPSCSSGGGGVSLKSTDFQDQPSVPAMMIAKRLSFGVPGPSVFMIP